MLEQRAEDEVRCPYPGSRRGRLMNRAGLEQQRRHWDAICATVASLCPERTLISAWRASLLALAGPALAPDPLPGSWAALYKASVGFNQVFTHLCLHGEELPDDLFDWLEAGGWLLGGHQVCAGSRGQIEELYACFGSAVAGEPLPIPRSEAPVTFVALQAALALATYRSHPWGGLGAELLQQGQAPWLHAVTSTPGLDPALTLRFFPEGAAPRALTRFLEAEPASLPWPERDALFWSLTTGEG